MEDDSDMRPEMKKKKWSPGHLYILDYGDGKQFKIGITTNNPQVRANQITQNSGMLLPNPIGAELVFSLYMDTNPYYLEQLLHMNHFAKHTGGEWFHFEDITDLVDTVSSILILGEPTYYDRWFDLLEDGAFGMIVHDIYPIGLPYVRDLSIWRTGSEYVLAPSSERGRKAIEAILRENKKYSYDCKIRVLDREPTLDELFPKKEVTA